MKVIHFILIVVCSILLGITLSSCGHETIDFNSDVRPILNQNCLSCHGGVKAQSDLSFLFEEDAFKKAKSGEAAIKKGNAAGSELYKRITSEDPDLIMPAESHPLTDQEIYTIKKWIDQGAEWDTHWAYIAPNQDITIPKHDSQLSINAIDHFIFDRLDQEGLSPSESADRSTIIRRVSLDLIGLPPTMEQTEKFLSDDSEESYETLVDDLLSSPHFGERWAAVWLDLARYADSQGYQKDLIRKHIWRYRDWVINAFNKDMPFDEFTIQQLAGDLLNTPSDQELLATTFHRNTMTNDEGGTDNEEFRVAAVLDRVNTTFEVWQGTTISCVQCHSHPYDPIRHEEYYQLYAFFNTTADADHNRDLPLKVLDSPEDQRLRERYGSAVEEIKSTGDTISEQYKSKLTAYLDIEAAPVPIMQELPEESSRKTHVFERGNWLVHGDEVTPQTPGFLPEFNEQYEKNRLGLARWLVSQENPLTSRVIVNRFWEQIFGKGLVRTLEDFGTQGNKPSHPELLDWLAVRFRTEDQWSVKSLLKLMVMSHTYRQSSDISAEALKKDPENELLARASRYRLSAEAIRDQALVVSGLFNPKVYGKSVMPNQPDGVWNVIRHAIKWNQDTTGNQYRRALYTFWRRVSPYPSMQTFDAPSRELCVSRRIRTNTPLQALITLNDPVYVEASEHLAQESINQGGNDLDSQINYMYTRALMKIPDPSTKENLIRFYQNTKEEYRSNTDQALEDAEIELYTMTNLASVLLNLDEIIMKN